MDMNDRILIVDDEETLCEALRFNLEAEGYRVDTANSAEQVLAMDVSGYDLLLLDIMMGEISGIQLAKILKANPALFPPKRTGESENGIETCETFGKLHTVF